MPFGTLICWIYTYGFGPWLRPLASKGHVAFQQNLSTQEYRELTWYLVENKDHPREMHRPALIRHIIRTVVDHRSIYNDFAK